MKATFVIAALLAASTVAGAVEFPDSVSASKCKGKKKIFGFLDDPTSTPSVRKIKMRNSFYVQAGSAYVQGCRTAKGSSECQETFGLSLFLTPGFTGETPCFSQSGLPFIDYYRTVDGTYQYWSSTDECTVTVTKYDETRGRVKGTYRARVAQLSLPEPVYGDLVGCFSARRQDLGPID
jgi:hypothetical protein